MPSRTLNVAGAFPDGTEIKAYPVANWPSHQQDSPSGAPVGAASDTETVSGAAVTFTLDEGRYFATDATGTRYLGFHVGQDQAEGSGASRSDLASVQADLDTAEAALATAEDDIAALEASRQTKRVAIASLAAGANVSVTVTWDTAFPDTNYTFQVACEDAYATGTNLGLAVQRVDARTAAGLVVRVKNNGAGAITGTLHATAVAD